MPDEKQMARSKMFTDMKSARHQSNFCMALMFPFTAGVGMFHELTPMCVCGGLAISLGITMLVFKLKEKRQQQGLLKEKTSVMTYQPNQAVTWTNAVEVER